MSARRKPRVPVHPHVHCRVCGMPVPADEEFCSTDCESRYRGEERRMRRSQKLYYTILLALMAFIFIIYIIIPFFARG